LLLFAAESPLHVSEPLRPPQLLDLYAKSRENWVQLESLEAMFPRAADKNRKQGASLSTLKVGGDCGSPFAECQISALSSLNFLLDL
jgi:hypothetical protein